MRMRSMIHARPPRGVHLVLDGDLPQQQVLARGHLAPAGHRVELLRLAIELGDHGQQGPEDGHADGQHVVAQHTTAVDADLVTAHLLGQFGHGRGELLLADLLLGVEDQEHVRVADGPQREAVDHDRLHDAATGGVADELRHATAATRQDEPGGVRMPALGEFGELERDLGAGLLGHDPERPGERAVLIEQDPDPGRRLAEKAPGQLARRPAELVVGHHGLILAQHLRRLQFEHQCRASRRPGHGPPVSAKTRTRRPRSHSRRPRCPIGAIVD
jgi:hypothetical protein